MYLADVQIEQICWVEPQVELIERIDPIERIHSAKVQSEVIELIEHISRSQK